MNAEQVALLRRAFLDAELQELEQYNDILKRPVAFSPAFEKKMNRLIRRRRAFYWQFTNTVCKRVCVGLAMLAIIFSMSMSVSAIRRPVVELMVHVKDAFVEFFVGTTPDSLPKTVETVYTFSALPDGYEWKNREMGTQRVKTTWTNQKHDMILKQSVISTGSITVDSESDELYTVEVNGFAVQCTQRYQIRTFVWMTDEYQYILICSSEIEAETALAMIRDMIPEK